MTTELEWLKELARDIHILEGNSGWELSEISIKISERIKAVDGVK